jgi:two-component system alkaline phosphatase synthesis response regulator PhoP
MPRVLVIEDEHSLQELLRLNLELEGYQVTLVSDGRESLNMLDKIDDFDLVVLDVMLPFVRGLDVCRKIRAVSKVPILFLSAKGTSVDRITGLKLGANDYLPKPFDLEELFLRISNLIPAKLSEKDFEYMHFDGFEVNFRTFQVMKNNTELCVLSKREIDLLKVFYKSRGEVVSRDRILDEIWGIDQFPTSRTIDNYILNFRKIFEPNPKEPKYFHSIRGVGYRFTI